MHARVSWITLALAVSAHAAPPGLESIFPAGGRIGSHVEIHAAGAGLDKESLLAWTNDPHIVILAGDKPKKYFLSIAKDATPGPYLVRFYSDSGATPPRIIEVGSLEEITEKESNESFAIAKTAEAKMNVIINGGLEKAGDVDTYAIRVLKDKRIALELHGYALGSPMDPAMRLLNERGIEIAAGHDTHNLDPRIDHTPLENGTLFVQVFAFAHPPAADIALKGSANHVYRLMVTDEVKKTATDEPKVLTLSATIHGNISKPGEEDRFNLQAKKGDDLQINVRAQALRSPLDATLRIEDADGKILQQTDDGEKENLDPSLRWKVPKDGEFKLVIADRFQHGSADHVYELSLKPFIPTITATLDTHAYRMEADKTAEVKLNVKINGTLTGKIQAKAAKLPVGITAEPVDVPAKGGEIKLTLKAAADAAISQSPFAVEITTSAPDSIQTTTASYAIPFTEPRGDLLITTDTHPWLTISGKAPTAK